MSSLQHSLVQQLSSSGWTVRSDGGSIAAEREEILSKWMLGKRSVRIKLELQFDEPNKKLVFREVAVEKSSGLAPPTFSVSTTTQSGTKFSEHRIDVGVGGGGVMEYGKARQFVEQQCASEGWVFKLEI